MHVWSISECVRVDDRRRTQCGCSRFLHLAVRARVKIDESEKVRNADDMLVSRTVAGLLVARAKIRRVKDNEHPGKRHPSLVRRRRRDRHKARAVFIFHFLNATNEA